MQENQLTDQNVWQLKKDIISELFPAECDLIGEADLENFLNGPVELRQLHFGAKLNLHEVYETVAAAVDFLNNCLSIFITLKGSVMEAEPKRRLIEELITKTTTTTITEGDKRTIIQEVEQRLKRYE